jgi:hypothetical protein
LDLLSYTTTITPTEEDYSGRLSHLESSYVPFFIENFSKYYSNKYINEQYISLILEML